MLLEDEAVIDTVVQALEARWPQSRRRGRPGTPADVVLRMLILKIAGALGPDVIEQLHRQVVEVAKRAGVTHGRRFRIDTTAVRTNVRYPTDSSLLQDGVRVLTRAPRRPRGRPGAP